MRRALPLLVFLPLACGPGARDGDTGDGPSPVQSLELKLEIAQPEVSQGQPVSIVAHHANGTLSDVTSQVVLSIEGTALVIDSGPPMMIRAVAEGTATIVAQLGDQVARSTVTVMPAHLETLAVTTSGPLGRGELVELSAMGHFADQHDSDLTAMVTFSSSDPTIASIREGNKLVGVALGEVDITATFNDKTASLHVAIECRYPSAAPASISSLGLMPKLSWTGAFGPDGESHLDFSMESFFCSDDYADKQTMVFVIGAGWCPSCPEYFQRVNDQASQLEAAGAQIIFMEAETANYGSANHAYAQHHIETMIPNGHGIRVGDGETKPRADTIRNSPIVTAFPTVFVVRKRDMKMIADQNLDPYYMDILQIVQNPEWNWTDPQNPTMGFTSHCMPGQDEASEPNDTSATAQALEQATVVQGGICNEEADFFHIATPGAWRVTIRFTQSVGDIDVDLWNTGTNQAVLQNGMPVGSHGSRDFESFDYNGPATIRVFGFRGSSAPYTMYFETL